MTSSAKFKFRMACIIILAAPLLAAPPATAASPTAENILRLIPKLPDPPEAVVPKTISRISKIDPNLIQLEQFSTLKGLGNLESRAKALAVPLDAGTGFVAVALSAIDRSKLPLLEEAVDNAGGTVTARLGLTIYARIPLNTVRGFERVAELDYLSAQLRAEPTTAHLVSEGVELVKADRLHRAGITGKNVKIGIIDWGYMKYRQLQSIGELPEPKATKLFRAEGTVWTGAVHGTACAEIIHDMAPDAGLYLAAISGREDEIIRAARWLAEQHVDIISFSGGAHNGPHDGRANLDLLVTEIVTQHGILWVNAAGNEGARHWGGFVTDANHNGWLDIGTGGNEIIATLMAPSANYVAFQVSWNDWGENPSTPTATLDLDAYLYTYDPKTQRLSSRPVAQSTHPQQGLGPPVEIVYVQNARADLWYVLGIRAKTGQNLRPVKLHVLNLAASRPEQAPLEPAGSIGIPATAQHALTVAAVNARTGAHESYSSQGPTDTDEFLKPDVAGPASNRSLAYGNSDFPGTSAACPHVSGFAALLKQIHPGANEAELFKLVIKNVEPQGSPIPNGVYGYGTISAAGIDVEGIHGGGRGGPQIELPGYFGEVSLATLEALRNSSGELNAWDAMIAVGRKPTAGREVPVYRIDDELRLGYRSDRECYYALLHRDSEGSYTMLMPGRSDPQKLRKDKKYLFPGTITISPPRGREEFILICAKREIDLGRIVTSGADSIRGDVVVAVAEYEIR